MTEVRNCWIHNCQDAGIRYFNVMGGPMVEANHIYGCDTGIFTWDSSTQMMGNWIFNNHNGVHTRGWAGPSINGNEIYDYDDNFEPNISYSDIKGGWAGTGNIDEAPCFFSVEQSTGSWTDSLASRTTWLIGCPTASLAGQPVRFSATGFM